MSSMSDLDVMVQEGSLRVRLVPEDCREQPDWDGQSYVWGINSSYYRTDVTHLHSDGAYGKNKNVPSVHHALVDAFARWGHDLDTVERYVRMFYDVVSFDFIQPYNDPYIYLAITTRDLAVSWGCEPDAETVRQSAKDTLDSWRQYAEGDVYGYVVESRVRWTNDQNDDEMDTWEGTEDGSLWGLYGREYAESEARGALADEAAHRADLSLQV